MKLALPLKFWVKRHNFCIVRFRIQQTLKRQTLGELMSLSGLFLAVKLDFQIRPEKRRRPWHAQAWEAA